MDHEQIDDLIEELTTTGKPELDKEPIQSLYNLCRLSKENLEFAYTNAYGQLQQNHSEVRYSAFQIIDKLFMRSHSFRLLVLNDLPDIFTLAMESDYPEQKLPAPTSTGEKLKKMALQRFYMWYKRFGKGYRLLELGFEYLSNVKQVKFNQIHTQTDNNQQLKDREVALRRSRIDQVDMQFEDRKTSFLSDCQEMENCFAMLVKRYQTVNGNINNDDGEMNDNGGFEEPENNEPIGNQTGILIIRIFSCKSTSPVSHLIKPFYSIRIIYLNSGLLLLLLLMLVTRARLYSGVLAVTFTDVVLHLECLPQISRQPPPFYSELRFWIPINYVRTF